MNGTKKVFSSLVAVSIMSGGASFYFETNAQTVDPTQVVEIAQAEIDEVTSMTVDLILGNSTWHYEDTDSDMYAQKFYEKGFDISSWKSNIGPLGYPVNDNNPIFGAISQGTLVNSVSKPEAIITYYFAKDFTVESLEGLTQLKAVVGVDDGFVLYLNGVEVNRSYIGEGEVTHATAANYVNEPSDAEGTVELDLTSVANLLVEGQNRIAVSVHNRDANSSDIYFDMNLTATYGESVDEGTGEEEQFDETKNPKQVNAHMGNDASTQVNLSYTTISGDVESKVVYNKAGDSTLLMATGTNSVGNASKYFHLIELSNLEPNTDYEYTVGEGENTYSGTFKTAPAVGSKETIKFTYIADPQVSNATNAEAAGATFAQMSDDMDFLFIAGDITNTATSETQWEELFDNGGAFASAGQEVFGSYLISAVQGNHDNNTLTRHINTPTEAGNIVYSFDYGPATFIMLNLESARYSADARSEQKEYLTQAVNEAKERGQWTFVGFHKSLYTGASHITDSDVIEARKYWAPIFSELDVDIVMQGHDHVYSRGFVNVEGYNANPEVDSLDRVINPTNSPLYMVGGHAGGLKWYSKKNYTVGEGDPLAPGYTFLDVNSTDTGSDVNQEQVYIEFEVSENELTFNTYMFKYDTELDEITTDPYLYDSLTVVKSSSENAEYQASLGNISNVDPAAGTEVSIPVILNQLDKVEDIRSIEMVFDIPTDLAVSSVALNNKIIVPDNWDYNVADGTLRIALGNMDGSSLFVNGTEGSQTFANVTLELTEAKNPGDTTQVTLSQLVLRCNDDLDVEYDTSNAVSVITFAQAEDVTAVARELYVSEGTDLIDVNLKAVAVEFSSIPTTTEVKYKETLFYYSEELTDRNGGVTYIALVSDAITLDELSVASNYSLINKQAQAESILFGDVNQDGIDAQDALAVVSAWLRKTEVTNQDILSLNVSADGKLNTRDAIDIVDHFVSGKEFKVIFK